MKILIIEERNLLREKIAGMLSREENIALVVQASSFSKLQTALKETSPDLVLGDFFEFNKFCKETGISADKLYPDVNFLLYTDEYEQLFRDKSHDVNGQRVFSLPRIQKEVRGFMQDAKQRKQDKKN